VAPALVVGAVLIAGAVEAGARGITVGWPFACYPTFQDHAPARFSTLTMVGVRPDGAEIFLDPVPGLDGNQAARARAMDARLIRTARSPDAPARFADRWRQRQARTGAPRDAERDLRAVRFYASSQSTAPEERGRPPNRETLLYELSLD